jgi:zinc protease
MLSGVPAQGKSAADVETALRAEVQRVAAEGISPAELDRVINQWSASAVYQQDSVFNQARMLGANWTTGLPTDFDEQLLERLRTVTPAQVQAVAARYFGNDDLTVATLIPQALDPMRRARAALPGVRH